LIQIKRHTKVLLKYNGFIYEGALREKSAGERSDKCRGRPKIVLGTAAISLMLAGMASGASLTQGMSRPRSLQAAPKTGGIMEDVLIPNVAPLKWGSSGETTFAGALAAASAVMPEKADYTRIMGDTGLAFRLRWFDPAAGKPYVGVGAVGEFPREIALAGDALGLTLKPVHAPKSDPIKREAIDQELLASINEFRPVICYVDPNMDCGLIYGYKNQGKSYLVRDYYSETAPEQPYDKLGFFFLFLETGKTPLARKDAVMKGLEAAVENWTRTDEKEMGGTFAYGAAGYEAWIAALSSDAAGSGNGLNNHVNWWLMDTLIDARGAATKYLRANASLFSPAAQAHLLKAAQLYDEELGVTSATFNKKDVFLGPWTGKSDKDWTPEVRTHEKALLAQCKTLEAQAIAEIEKALAAEK